MLHRISVALILTAVIGAQTPKTARQLFYTDEQDTAAKAPAAKKQPVKPPAMPVAARKKASTPAAPVETATAPLENRRATPPSTPEVAVTPAKYVPVSTSALGLRYSLIQIRGGVAAEVAADTTFRSGDEVQLRVVGNRPGYLYVVQRGSSGNWSPLFPSREIAGGDNRVSARQPFDLPSPEHSFAFDEQPGEEHLFIVYSMQPVADLDQLIYELRNPDRAPGARPKASQTLIAQNMGPISDSTIAGLRNTYARDLIIQKLTSAKTAAPADPRPDGEENAVYVVNGTGGRVVADIQLVHK
jgi:hypothetical protein